MTLLDWARGPLLQWSLVIFAIGVAWRLLGTILLLRQRRLSAPRSNATLRGGIRTIVMRSVPPHELEKNIVFQHVTGYLWHIGFFVTLLFFGPHLPFFESILGFGWPGLPNGLVTVTAALTLAILIALLVRRLMHPVLRLISTADDYISVLVTLLPLVTGLVSYAGVLFEKETNLALHILSVELLLVWFPFGKLMHLFLAFPARYQAGADFARTGVKA